MKPSTIIGIIFGLLGFVVLELSLAAVRESRQASAGSKWDSAFTKPRVETIGHRAYSSEEFKTVMHKDSSGWHYDAAPEEMARYISEIQKGCR